MREVFRKKVNTDPRRHGGSDNGTVSFFLHGAQDETKHDMFEHIDVIAGVKAVAIVEHRFDIYFILNMYFIDAVVRPAVPVCFKDLRTSPKATNSIEIPGQTELYQNK